MCSNSVVISHPVKPVHFYEQQETWKSQSSERSTIHIVEGWANEIWGLDKNVQPQREEVCTPFDGNWPLFYYILSFFPPHPSRNLIPILPLKIIKITHPLINVPLKFQHADFLKYFSFYVINQNLIISLMDCPFYLFPCHN